MKFNRSIASTTAMLLLVIPAISIASPCNNSEIKVKNQSDVTLNLNLDIGSDEGKIVSGGSSRTIHPGNAITFVLDSSDGSKGNISGELNAKVANNSSAGEAKMEFKFDTDIFRTWCDVEDPTIKNQFNNGLKVDTTKEDGKENQPSGPGIISSPEIINSGQSVNRLTVTIS